MTSNTSLSPGPVILAWSATTSPPPLAWDTVHLWRLNLDGDTPQSQVEALLAANERERAQSINNPAARRTYSRARAAKRLILSGYLGISTKQLILDAGLRGKPFIKAPTTDLQFNLTHSGDLALLAVVRGREVGLDAERLQTRKGLLRIAERMFGKEQTDELRGLADDEQQRLFHILWTRLEAGVKCHGGGLFDGESHQDQGISLTSFVPLAGYQACVAVPLQCPEPAVWKTFSYRL